MLFTLIDGLFYTLFLFHDMGNPFVTSMYNCRFDTVISLFKCTILSCISAIPVCGSGMTGWQFYMLKIHNKILRLCEAMPGNRCWCIDKIHISTFMKTVSLALRRVYVKRISQRTHASQVVILSPRLYQNIWHKWSSPQSRTDALSSYVQIVHIRNTATNTNP